MGVRADAGIQEPPASAWHPGAARIGRLKTIIVLSGMEPTGAVVAWWYSATCEPGLWSWDQKRLKMGDVTYVQYQTNRPETRWWGLPGCLMQRWRSA